AALRRWLQRRRWADARMAQARGAGGFAERLAPPFRAVRRERLAARGSAGDDLPGQATRWNSAAAGAHPGAGRRQASVRGALGFGEAVRRSWSDRLGQGALHRPRSGVHAASIGQLGTGAGCAMLGRPLEQPARSKALRPTTGGICNTLPKALQAL